MKNKIIGAGGGGGSGSKPRAPVEASDSLVSKSYARVIDLISEGEIEGLVNGLKSIYLDGTPIQSPNSSTLNFSEPRFNTRNGTQDQTYMDGFSTVESEVAVGVEILDADPVVRTFSNGEVDGVRVRLSFPQVTFQNQSTGDLVGTEITFAIDLQANGGGYQEVIRQTIRGKSTSKYEKAFRVNLNGEPPWDIRVRRITPRSTQANLQNRIFWESYTEIVDGKFSYPNSALVAIEIDSSQFNSIPTRGYHVRGLKIRVPSNYNPTTREYSGSWDGTFQTLYSNNPAWIFYDVLTAERYGFGSFIPEAQVDKWALYEIGRYCDELVPNGFGGFEPRFTCNAYFQTRQSAYKVLQDLASVFRGMMYWSGGQITVSQDAPSDPAYLFNTSNVVDGSFSYSGSSVKSRHTVAVVTWNDPSDLYRQKVEYVEDAEAIARYGVLEAQVVAFGCTSRGQANRVGKWLLYSERYQTEVVNFKTGLNGSLLRPGQVVKVADPMRAGSRRGGRILSATTTTITIDQSVSINPSTHTLSVLMPDGTVVDRALSTALGNQLTVSTAFFEAPPTGAVWMVSSADLEPQLFRIIGIAESEGALHEITAVAHNASKYDAIELGLALETADTSNLSAVPEAPTNLTLTETLYEVNADVRVKITVSWNIVPNASSYVVQYQRDELNPIELPQTSSNDIEILNAEPGLYRVTVYAFNALGTISPATTGQKKILGKALPPQDVNGFSLMPVEGQAYLSWDKATDLDVLIGGTVRIRYSPNIVDPVWKNSVDIVPALPGNASRVLAPLLTGSYMAKFIDSSGNASIEEAIIQTTIPQAIAINNVETLTENPAFSGVKTSMEYDSFYGGIVLSAAFSIDGYLDDIDTIVNWDYAGGVAPEGTYDFSAPVDLEAVYTSRVTAIIDAEAVDVTDSIDQRIELVDDWADLDGDFIDDVNAELFMQTTLDDPSDGGATWSEFKRFFVGDYLARGYRFRLKATSGQQSHNIVIKGLSVTVDMPDRVVNLKGINSGTSFYDVVYPEPFAEVPAVGITANNLNSGDFYQITNNTRQGFRITFKNSGGTIVSRQFDVIANGFGREI